MKKIFIICLLFCMMLFPLLAVEYPEGCPQFSSTSGDKVLFRYKYAVNQKVVMEMSMVTYIKTSSQMGDIEIPFTMTFEAYYVVKGITAQGNAEATMIISRMTMEAEGFVDISYDSADPESVSDPNFSQANCMVDVPIPIVITPLGELLDMDTNPLLEAAEKLGTQINPESFKQQIKELTESSFVQLSRDPLKAGDIYDAGSITSTFGMVNPIEASVKYQVIAVSGDKKKALLKPIVTFSFPDMTIKQSEFDGWILFDLEKGNIAESNARQLLELEIEEMGETNNLFMEMVVEFKTDI
jgi:hypothetical protein